MPYAKIRTSTAYQELLSASARLGQDRLQVQGPGGNTSLKREGAMWIKASGTWLADAEADDIMVPVDAEALLQALDACDPRSEDPSNYVAATERPSHIGASIETPVHAALSWSVVLHTHCVATIAVAVRADAERIVTERLQGMGAIFVPYAKPGAALARAIRRRIKDDTRIVVLGNHGLVVCGRTVEEAVSTLREASRRLAPATVAPGVRANPAFTSRLEGSTWMPVPHPETQAIATDPARLALARGTSLYPDHAVFLGPTVAAAPFGSDPESFVNSEPRSKIIVVEGEGVAMPRDASRPALALARCLGDVLARMDPEVSVRRLRDADVHALLNWDAEKRRQALNDST